jgi:hypothetical protein
MGLYDELELTFHCHIDIWKKRMGGQLSTISGITLYSVNLRYC